jgi:hypothetical protein
MEEELCMTDGTSVTENYTEWGLRYPFRLEGAVELYSDQVELNCRGLRFSLKISGVR